MDPTYLLDLLDITDPLKDARDAVQEAVHVFKTAQLNWLSATGTADQLNAAHFNLMVAQIELRQAREAKAAELNTDELPY